MPAKRKAAAKIVRHSRRAAINIGHANRNVRQAAQLAVSSGAAAGAASFHTAMRAIAQLYQDAAGEGIAAMALMQKMAAARTPLEVLDIQSKAACAAWERMIARAFAAGEAMMRAQWSAAAPIARAANVNARRLAAN